MNESARTIGTSCVLDCPDACSLEVTVEEGRVAKIGPAGLNDVTQDFICSKVGRFADRLYHPDRLLHPMRRIGPKGEARFERIDWDEALGTITERFREHPGQRRRRSDPSVQLRRLERVSDRRSGRQRLLRSPRGLPTRTRRSAPRPLPASRRGCTGRWRVSLSPTIPRPSCILIWGANPRASNIHLVPYLREAKERGAFIALVDPVRTLSTDLIDLHLPVFPGADLPLALGMIHHWAETGRFDRAFLDAHAVELETLLDAASEWSLDRAAKEARVDRESIRLLADRYADASPAVLRCGWGLERNRNGGQAAAAILAMPALLGKFGRRGGGYTLSNSGAGKLDASKLWDTASWTTRVINMTELARVLNEPDTAQRASGPRDFRLQLQSGRDGARIRTASCGVCLREDLFTVVFEQVMTDTARYADILLPATTMLEHYDYKRSYGSYVVGATKPVIEPCRRSSQQCFGLRRARPRARVSRTRSSIGRRRSSGRESSRPSSFRESPSRPSPSRRGGMERYDFDGSSNPVQFESVFPQTEDGKIHLTPAVLGPAPYAYEEIHSESFPLCLITPASSKLVSSTFGEFNVQELHLTIHPDDARQRGDRLRRSGAGLERPRRGRVHRARGRARARGRGVTSQGRMDEVLAQRKDLDRAHSVERERRRGRRLLQRRPGGSRGHSLSSSCERFGRARSSRKEAARHLGSAIRRMSSW